MSSHGRHSDAATDLLTRLRTVDPTVLIGAGVALILLVAALRWQRTRKHRWERLSREYRRLHASAERLGSRLDRPAVGLYERVGRSRPRAFDSLAAAERGLPAARGELDAYEELWAHTRTVGRRYAGLNEPLHSVEADLNRALEVVADAEAAAVERAHDRLDRADRVLDRAERRASLRAQLTDCTDPTERLDISGLEHVLATCNVEVPPSARVHDIDRLATLVEAADVLAEVSHWESSVVPGDVIDGFDHAVAGHPVDVDWILEAAWQLYRLSRRSSGPWWQTEQ